MGTYGHQGGRVVRTFWLAWWDDGHEWTKLNYQTDGEPSPPHENRQWTWSCWKPKDAEPCPFLSFRARCSSLLLVGGSCTRLSLHGGVPAPCVPGCNRFAVSRSVSIAGYSGLRKRFVLRVLVRVQLGLGSEHRHVERGGHRGRWVGLLG